MKNIFTYFIIAFVLCCGNINAQNAPAWTADMNTAPDPASLLPVRVVSNTNDTLVYVLNTYKKVVSPDTFYKIYVSKYNYAGVLKWTLVFDNGGSGNPQGFDMAVDNVGNCYVAGGFISNNNRPLLMKINSGGSVAWLRDSTTAFNSGLFKQVFIHNNLIYVSSGSGVAVFDLDGNEKWSHVIDARRMAVDNAGQMVVSTYGVMKTIFRYDTNGVLNFSDSTINADRIALDAHNNIYLLRNFVNAPYVLVKYDSSGVFQWSNNSLSHDGGFGALDFEMLTDYNNDVLLVGLTDTMVKVSPAGNILWKKGMNGLGSYYVSAGIGYSNLLAVAGNGYSASNYFMKVALFNINGDEAWQGTYNGNTGGTEFIVDMAIGGGGFYVIENNNFNTTMAKFNDPSFSKPIDFSLFCVDSVWYASLNPNYVNVRIFNGSAYFVSYPSEQAVSPAGDTIINPKNRFNYYGQAPNTYQTYTDTITIAGITDFSTYTFLFTARYGKDTTVVIGWCGTTGVNEIAANHFIIYPNPARNQLSILVASNMSKGCTIRLYDLTGRNVFEKSFHSITGENKLEIDVSGVAKGIYVVTVGDGVGEMRGKVVVE